MWSVSSTRVWSGAAPNAYCAPNLYPPEHVGECCRSQKACSCGGMLETMLLTCGMTSGFYIFCFQMGDVQGGAAASSLALPKHPNVMSEEGFRLQVINLVICTMPWGDEWTVCRFQVCLNMSDHLLSLSIQRVVETRVPSMHLCQHYVSDSTVRLHVVECFGRSSSFWIRDRCLTWPRVDLSPGKQCACPVCLGPNVMTDGCCEGYSSLAQFQTAGFFAVGEMALLGGYYQRWVSLFSYLWILCFLCNSI